jgi:hypothetical protein
MLPFDALRADAVTSTRYEQSILLQTLAKTRGEGYINVSGRSLVSLRCYRIEEILQTSGIHQRSIANLLRAFRCSMLRPS